MGKVRHGDHCKHSIIINKNTEDAGAVTYFLPMLGKFLKISELSEKLVRVSSVDPL